MRQIKFDLENLGLFREAKPSDIIEGNTVFLIGDGDEMHRKTIEEVLSPKDPWKGFCAEDGCRYGLDDLYILEEKQDTLVIDLFKRAREKMGWK